MPSRAEIENEISRLQDKMDIYVRAGKLTEAQRISSQIESLLKEL